jgi:2-amino-4-hydroxy-6-hydroxymethyldihydropteridine diphosphokinase
MSICYLGVGSNLGNRRKNIKAAIGKIKKLPRTRLLRASRIIQTDPVGGPTGQPKFLNAALKIQTRIPPRTLLAEIKKIEKELGRTKTVKNGPRAIDLDILLYGSKIIRTRKLVIPHPRMFERAFVLKPLSEII